jgi:hypothetical protein
MSNLTTLGILFVLWALFFQIVMIVYFGLRKWKFDIAMRVGWIVYALGIPAAALSAILYRGGLPWSLWLGGFIFLIWSIFGYTVEFILGIKWRDPIRWPIFIPYMLLYLATVMFYWWPLGLLSRPLWFVYMVLVIIGFVLNITSHKKLAVEYGIQD